MNQKNKTILVGVLALAVWIYAGKEWLGYLGTDTEKKQAINTSSNILPSKLYVSNESYEATYGYKDPFLSVASSKNSGPKIVQNNSTVQNNNRIKPPEIKIQEPVVPKIEIKYQGLISNEKGTFGLLTINEKPYIVSVGDLVEEIKVLSVENEYIEVMLNQEKRIFKK